MKAIIRLIAANNFLPIAVTFVCFQFFSKYYTLSVDYFLCLLATFGTWFIYFYDKIIDNKKRLINPTERHALTPLDFKIQIAIGLCLAILCLVNFHFIPLNHLFYYCHILPLISVYFIWSKKAQIPVVGFQTKHKFFSKEIFSSLVITIVISFFPIIGQGVKINFLLHIVFFCMVFSNMLLLSISDYEVDKKNNFNSITMAIGRQKAIGMFYFLLLIIIALVIYFNIPFLIYWGILFVVSFSVLCVAVMKQKVDAILVHILADSLFLLPLLFF